MENTLLIEQTKKSPLVKFDLGENHLQILGRSMPENATTFYNPVFDIIRNYRMESLLIDIDLDYLNSTSSKCIYNLIVYAGDRVKKVNINWFHDVEDEDMVDYVKDIEKLSGMKITIIEKSI